MSQSTILQTERLVLRKLSEADSPALLAGINDYDVSKWLTVVPYPYSEADAREFLAYLDDGPALDGFGIHAPEGLVGVVGVAGTLGYWLAQPAWGRGYATEAARALVGHFFAVTAEESLGSGYFVGNAGSKNVLTKLGFRPNGEERVTSQAQDAQVTMIKMRLTRADWEATRGH